MTLEEILAIEDTDKKIYLLKQYRRTKRPDVASLKRDWNPKLHAVMDEKLRPKRRVLVKDEYVDDDGVTHKAEYKDEDVNRIAVPIEQDIVNIHTAFTVGKDPNLDCTPNNDAEKNLFSVVQSVNSENKIRYHNKRIVRSWFSETEMAEYWYTVDAGNFWNRVKAKFRQIFTGKVSPAKKLKCNIWSPFRGDSLYPFFDDSGDFKAMSREYTMKEYQLSDLAVKDVRYFQTVTDTDVFVWKYDNGSWQLVPEKSFLHGFTKIPCIYGYRPESLCEKIRPLRERYEKTLSNYADCIDYHFFPYLILEGDLAGENGLAGQDERRRVIKIENEGKAYYLTWDQTPEAIRLELDNLTDKIYAFTHTFQMSSKNIMEAASKAVSGRALTFTFIGSHMEVENHAEVLGEFLQRRYNFLVSAIGSICPSLKNAADTIDIEVKIVPFTIDDISERLDIAGKAKSSGFMSTRSGIMFVGLTDQVDEELKQIEKERTESTPDSQSANRKPQGES